MIIKHVGIRPKNDLLSLNVNDRKYLRYELHPGGGHTIWTMRMLKSGCNNIITEIKLLKGCVYCPHCREYFSMNQFEEVEEKNDDRPV